MLLDPQYATRDTFSEKSQRQSGGTHWMQRSLVATIDNELNCRRLNGVMGIKAKLENKGLSLLQFNEHMVHKEWRVIGSDGVEVLG